MFFRLLFESFYRQRRRKLLAGVAILLGTTAVTAMLALATTIGDRIHQELAVYGANIVVTPQADTLDVKVGGVNLKPATGGAYLHESDLVKLRGIFWANNITGVSPEFRQDGTMLVRNSAIHETWNPRFVWLNRNISEPQSKAFPVTAVGYWFHHRFGDIITGAPELHPWWKIQGRWPVETEVTAHHGEDAEEIVLGSSLAARLGLKVGDWISLGSMTEADVVGIVNTGDSTDQQIIYPLDAIQPVPAVDGNGRALGQPQVAVSRVEISARTKPEDAFAKSDPDKLSPHQRDIWYCRPYANSIAYQIREAIPGAQATQVRQVEQSEGTVLSRISGLMWLISAAALLAAGFAVSAAMATAILERRAEIGLMRSLGASRGVIALLFYSETGVLAILAGLCGYLIGSGLAAWLGARIFAGDGGGSAALHLSAILIPALLPVVVGLALLVAIAGSTPAIRTALAMDPSAILRADA
jgi:putative ABC transport system permease protein